MVSLIRQLIRLGYHTKGLLQIVKHFNVYIGRYIPLIGITGRNLAKLRIASISVNYIVWNHNQQTIASRVDTSRCMQLRHVDLGRHLYYPNTRESWRMTSRNRRLDTQSQSRNAAGKQAGFPPPIKPDVRTRGSCSHNHFDDCRVATDRMLLRESQLF